MTKPVTHKVRGQSWDRVQREAGERVADAFREQLWWRLDRLLRWPVRRQVNRGIERMIRQQLILEGLL